MSTLVMNPTYRTEVFVSEDGFLVILQTNETGEQQEVHLGPDQTQTLFDYIKSSSLVA